MTKLLIDDEPHGVLFLIDNKPFYASCGAVTRGLNPSRVPLVVLSEAENTNDGLTLATPPEAKACGISKNTSAAFLCSLGNRSYFMVH